MTYRHVNIKKLDLPPQGMFKIRLFEILYHPEILLEFAIGGPSPWWRTTDAEHSDWLRIPSQWVRS